MELDPAVGTLGPACAVCRSNDYAVRAANVTIADADGCCAVIGAVCRDCFCRPVEIAPSWVDAIDRVHRRRCQGETWPKDSPERDRGAADPSPAGEVKI